MRKIASKAEGKVPKISEAEYAAYLSKLKGEDKANPLSEGVKEGTLSVGEQKGEEKR
ncbi:MAG: hypothetical protein IJV80_04865 [Clostridia bacterium]|nr:hypothetical protein [Clostridia bacterium]